MLTSIILPTYNRAAFLPGALGSIRAQRYTDWELIIVDDGSTDETQAVVSVLCGDLGDRVRYLRQENRGAYGARNSGLAMARGGAIAFFDSDDLWLPHHLDRCVAALVAHPDVDWVYGACRMVNLRTGDELSPNTFYENGRPRSFMRLHSDIRGALHVIDDPGLTACAILDGLHCGLQNSVIRSGVFQERQFSVGFSYDPEDQLFAIRAAREARRFAYFDAAHVVYRVHDENSSAANVAMSAAMKLEVHTVLAANFERLAEEIPPASRDYRAVRQRLSREYFWPIGYVLLWQEGRRTEALAMFRRGLRWWPWSARCWKTYLLSSVRAYWAP